MRICTNLSALALRQLITGACKSVGVTPGAAAVDGVVGFLVRHFVDHSQRLTLALQNSNERAWKALEVALAGESLWDRARLVFASGEDKAFREQVKPFLDRCAPAELLGRDAFRQACLAELRTARKAGLLSEATLDPSELARRAGALARFADPAALLDAEHQALVEMGGELRRAGHANLADLLALRPPQGEPLLVVAARYFFRRAVETDQALFQGLTFAQLEQVQESQRAGFDALFAALRDQGDKLELALSAVQQAVEATYETVLDVREEQRRQGEQAAELYQAVMALQGKLDLIGREVRPSDSLSIRNDHERALVKQLVGRYRALPEGDRAGMPALLNAIGQLEVAAGDFQAAQADFALVAALSPDRRARAEAHANAYRAALERRDWAGALAELREAVARDAARFAPFPVDKYRPERILGAGGFGVAFLCQHRFLKAPVVVKALGDGDLDRGIDAVFAEAQVLRQLDHPAIIRLQDCGFGGPDGETRPYLVMDYFEGQTLEDAARAQALSVDELLGVARQVAAGLHAAHGKGVLHRDVKPANLLVRRGEKGLEARLIDFGLALRRTGRETMLATSKTLTGSSIAGTLDYAAPEQMGKLDEPVSPASDIYGFARTCCFALFGTPQPLMRHWRGLPAALAELLESCLEEQPRQRPQSFTEVLGALDGLGGAVKKPSVAPPPVITPPTPAAGPRSQELTVLAAQVAGCTSCAELARGRTQVVYGHGPIDAPLCFIGEAPGAEEDRSGKPFVGASGRVLAEILGELGIDRGAVYITNLLKCKTPGNRPPATAEMKSCREHLLRELGVARPQVLVCLGASAAKALLGTSEPIGRLRGRTHDYRGWPVVCTYHPASLLPGRTPQNRAAVVADLRLALSRVSGPRGDDRGA